MRNTFLYFFIIIFSLKVYCADTEVNKWVLVSEGDVGPGFSPGIVWSPELKKFIFFSGVVDHQFKGERPYDILSFDPKEKVWKNELPKGAESRGGETGNVKEVSFKSPYYTMGDDEKLQIPNRRHMSMWYHYAFAPWDNKAYALICGRVLSYDPKERIWKETGAPVGPMPLTKTYRESLSWSALCADPVNKEILLFGGCGVLTPDGSPGTWAYSTEKNEWRKLTLKVEPPPRALSPMVYDPNSKKIVLFGGDRLDQLYADTWVYDCATRTWEEKKPAISPSPRFGHALIQLPKSGKIILIGGKGYRSSIDYNTLHTRPLPFEMWTYEISTNEWKLIQRYDKDGPPEYANCAAVATSSDQDMVLLVGPGTVKGSVHSTWACQVDPDKTDKEGTAKFGVKPDTLEFRINSFDPEWYSKDLPSPDPVAVEKIFNELTPNTWTALKAPRWPENRQGGGWSTVTYDSDNDQILHMGGGHSSYFGNDMAHYDIKNGRWSIACRPQFALEFNYDLNGPGSWGFNGAPWGNHNYHAYAYDPTLKKVVYIKGGMTLLYDPATRTWPHSDKTGDLPFVASKYINYLVSTPKGVYCWTQTKESQSKYGLWKLEEGKLWKEIKTTGESLPIAVCDSSTITYDSKRDSILITTSIGKDGPHGQIWMADLKTAEVKKLNPAGMELIKCPRFARESVYLPKNDMIMFGFLLQQEGGLVVPFYDYEKNSWLGAKIPGQEFFNRGAAGSSVDLGLIYEPKRNLVFATLCNLKPGSLQVIKIDSTTLGATPLK